MDYVPFHTGVPLDHLSDAAANAHDSAPIIQLLRSLSGGEHTLQMSLYCCVSCVLPFSVYRACMCISLHIESAAMWIGWLYSLCYASIVLHAGFVADMSDVIIWNHEVAQH